MNGGYEIIATILLYFLLLRTLDGPRMSPVKAATIFIVGTAILMVAFVALKNAMMSLAVLGGVMTFQDVATLAVQWLVAVGIFYKAEEAGDEYLSFAFWGGLGLALIFYVVPTLLNAVFAGLF